jgi:hypothetical protein
MSKMKKRDTTERVLYRLVLVVCASQWRYQWTYKRVLLLSSSSVGGEKKEKCKRLLADEKGWYFWNIGPHYQAKQCHITEDQIIIFTAMRISNAIPVLGVCVG